MATSRCHFFKCLLTQQKPLPRPNTRFLLTALQTPTARRSPSSRSRSQYLAATSSCRTTTRAAPHPVQITTNRTTTAQLSLCGRPPWYKRAPTAHWPSRTIDRCRTVPGGAPPTGCPEDSSPRPMGSCRGADSRPMGSRRTTLHESTRARVHHERSRPRHSSWTTSTTCAIVAEALRTSRPPLPCRACRCLRSCASARLQPPQPLATRRVSGERRGHAIPMARPSAWMRRDTWRWRRR